MKYLDGIKAYLWSHLLNEELINGRLIVLLCCKDPRSNMAVK